MKIDKKYEALRKFILGTLKQQIKNDRLQTRDKILKHKIKNYSQGIVKSE